MLNATDRRTVVLLLISVALLANGNRVYSSQDNSITSDEDHAAPEPGTNLREHYQEIERQRIAAKRERGDWAKDRGGMISLRMFRLPGERYIHPLPPDPLRRDAFDEWCESIGIFDAVPADTLETIWQTYVDRINRVLIDHYPIAFQLSAEVSATPGMRNRASAVVYSDMVEQSIIAGREANRTEDQLFRMLSSVDEGSFAETVESWHQYRRWERTSTFEIEVSGAEQHLSALMESISIDWPNRHLRLAYEMEIASAAERRFAHALSSTAPLYEIRMIGLYNEHDERYDPVSPEGREALEESRRAARSLRRQRWQHQREMYTINARYLTLLSIMLDRVDAERIYDTFMYEAFSDFFPNTYDLRYWFDQLLDDEPADQKLQRKIRELRQTYVTVQRGVDDALVRTFHHQQRSYMSDRSRNRTIQERWKRELDSELQRRFENALVFAGRLVELLDGRDHFDWVRKELEELLEVNLHRW